MTCICVTNPLRIVVSKITQIVSINMCAELIMTSCNGNLKYILNIDDVGKICKDFIKIPHLFSIKIILSVLGIKTNLVNTTRGTIDQ